MLYSCLMVDLAPAHPMASQASYPHIQEYHLKFFLYNKLFKMEVTIESCMGAKKWN